MCLIVETESVQLHADTTMKTISVRRATCNKRSKHQGWNNARAGHGGRCSHIDGFSSKPCRNQKGIHKHMTHSGSVKVREKYAHLRQHSLRSSVRINWNVLIVPFGKEMKRTSDFCSSSLSHCHKCVFVFVCVLLLFLSHWRLQQSVS